MKKNGFTLLELLVVIGIIGILVALATVSYSATQSAGRDSRRKQDMVAIQNALEQYYSDGHYAYPGNCVGSVEVMTYLRSDWPVDLEGDAYNPFDCDLDSYCVCALMEKPTSGNSGDGCNWSSADKTHYCVGNLQ